MTRPIAAEPVLAWFGDPDLKAATVAMMKEHRAADAFRQGAYQYMDQVDGEEGFVFKGCAIGCLLSGEDSKAQLAAGASLHHLTAMTFGLTVNLAWAIDYTFEGLPDFNSAGDFAVAIIEAIPVGANLSGLCCSEHVRILDPCPNGRFCLRHSLYKAQELIEAVATAPVPDPQEPAT